MTLSKKHQAIVAALRWELCWTPLETACVGIGLWMTLVEVVLVSRTRVSLILEVRNLTEREIVDAQVNAQIVR